MLGIYYAFAAHIVDFWEVDGMPLRCYSLAECFWTAARELVTWFLMELVSNFNVVNHHLTI